MLPGKAFWKSVFQSPICYVQMIKTSSYATDFFLKQEWKIGWMKFVLLGQKLKSGQKHGIKTKTFINTKF